MIEIEKRAQKLEKLICNLDQEQKLLFDKLIKNSGSFNLIIDSMLSVTLTNEIFLKLLLVEEKEIIRLREQNFNLVKELPSVG